MYCTCINKNSHCKVFYFTEELQFSDFFFVVFVYFVLAFSEHLPLVHDSEVFHHHLFRAYLVLCDVEELVFGVLDRVYLLNRVPLAVQQLVLPVNQIALVLYQQSRLGDQRLHPRPELRRAGENGRLPENEVVQTVALLQRLHRLEQ